MRVGVYAFARECTQPVYRLSPRDGGDGRLSDFRARSSKDLHPA